MKISVVIPVYNEEKYIEKCLNSLQTQEEMPDEIIIVDNNCTDKSIELAKNYKVKIIKENKQGITYARNCGFNAARYELIARCDADAIIPPFWVSQIKANFENEAFSALTGPVNFYDLKINTQFFVKIFFIIMRFLHKGETLVGHNMAIRKNIWDKVKSNLCLKDDEIHEDVDLAIHVLGSGGKIKFDDNLIIKASARRIMYNPISFFIEYPIRLAKTFLKHRGDNTQ